MKEVAVRKFHRLLGMMVVWFLAGQTLTGLILAVGGLAPGSIPPQLYQFRIDMQQNIANNPSKSNQLRGDCHGSTESGD